MLQVRESLTLRAKEFNILVDDVAITHLSFGTEAGLMLHRLLRQNRHGSCTDTMA